MRITVRVHPRASSNRVEPKSPGQFEVWVTAAPVDHEANAAVREALARHFGIAKSKVTLFRGATGRVKIFDVD